MKTEYWILPNRLIEKIRSQFTDTSKSHLDQLKKFIKGELTRLDPKIANYYNDVEWEDTTKLRRALNYQKEYGIAVKDGKTYFIDLLCLFAFKKNWVQTKRDYKIKDSEIQKRNKYKLEDGAISDTRFPNLGNKREVEAKSLYDKLLSLGEFVQDDSVVCTAAKETLGKQLIQLVKDAADAELRMYQSIPDLRTDELKKYYWENESTFRLLTTTYIPDIIKLNLSINNKDNPSGHDFYFERILKLTENEAVIVTIEFWILCWFDHKTQTYVDDEKIKWDIVNQQTYKLTKINEVWKIKSVHFPKYKNY